MRALAFAAGATVSTAALFYSGARAEPLPPIEPQKAGFSAKRLNRIEEFFSREIAQNRVPGAVVGVVRDGKIVYLKAFGYRDKEKGLPMQVDTIFGLASMTKPMVAVGVLALTEQGKLPLFSRLATYIPQFGAMEVAIKAADGSTQYEPQKHPITIQDLLRHTSGLTYGGRPDTTGSVSSLYPSGAALPGMSSSAEFINTITKLPLVYEPGTVWEYSGSFEVLGSVLEKLSGKTLGGYLADVIWKPLGMTDTGFHIDPAKRDRVAKAFPLDPLTGKPQKIRTTEEEIRFECGAAVPSVLWSTTCDSARC
jgi:CubicO group peptidase (beta-lactamase class C family)